MLLALAGTPALACPDTPNLFETFSLPAEALGHGKRIVVWLPPGYACMDRRYPVAAVDQAYRTSTRRAAAALPAPRLAV